MPIDTTVQPWIAKMLMPADGKAAGAALNDFAQGFAGGYLARKANTRAEMLAEGETPEPPTGFERLVRLANPEQQLSVDETLQRDLGTIGQEIGKLKTSQDIFSWVGKNAAMAASPIGHKVLTSIEDTGKRMADIESRSAAHIAAVEMAKKKADVMVRYNLPPDATPEQWGNANANDATEAFTEHAAVKLGKDVSGLISPQDFDKNGNWIPGAQQRILSQAPRSESLQVREDRLNRQAGTLSSIGKELQDYKALVASGDTENANLIKAKIVADADKNGVAIEFDDQGHPTRINIGGKSTTPPGITTRVEKTINAAADLVEYGNDLVRLATDSDNVGIWGNARRFAEQWGGQFGMQVNAQSAFDYASATALFRAGATQVLKSDSQIAEPERRELLNRVADAKLGESSASAIAETRYIQRKVAESARRQALRAGRPLAPQLMTPGEIVDAVSNGTMTREDGIKAVQSTPF
jgi:hypothetical protein